ncbi:MAG TPA: DNA repair protein RadC, partial [Chthoniobacterales bacterium]|nr:DNA repair protein RadC [Chthoniobacterales bacterium]
PCAICSSNCATSVSQPKLRELPEDARPREKLLSRGPGALTNAELIALLLQTGVPGTNVLEVAAKLLARRKTLHALSRCSLEEIMEEKGIGEAKAIQLTAAFQLGHRIAQEQIKEQKIDAPELVYDLLGAEMRLLQKESLRVLLLDTRYRLLRMEEISRGSLNESIAHPREVFRPAIVSSAYAVIVAHNHPSGDPTPSQSDHSLTRRLAEAAELLQIKLLDHVIIGAPAEGRLPYFSFKEAGVL